LATNCSQLKKLSAYGKYCNTDVADTKGKTAATNLLVGSAKEVQVEKKKFEFVFLNQKSSINA